MQENLAIVLAATHGVDAGVEGLSAAKDRSAHEAGGDSLQPASCL